MPLNTKLALLGAALLTATVAAQDVPLIDLAKDTSRQVIVDREAKQYLGHPTTVLLEDGKTIIAVYPKGHGAGAIVMKRSTDGGKTWSDRLPTPENWSTSKEVPTIYRIVDKAGKKRLVISDSIGREEEHLIPHGKHIIVAAGDKVKQGQVLTDGAVDPHERCTRSSQRAHLRQRRGDKPVKGRRQDGKRLLHDRCGVGERHRRRFGEFAGQRRG